MNYYIVEENEKNAIEYIKINVLAMKQAYKDIVNEEFLQEINSESEIQKMHDVHIKRIDDENDKSFILYVDDNPAGIFRVGSSRRDKYKDYGEFRAIYLLDEYKKKGYGKIMFQSGIKELIDMGYDKMILDCLKLNPTNNFYKHFGGKIIDTATVKMGEQELEENIYLYDNLKFMISF